MGSSPNLAGDLGLGATVTKISAKEMKTQKNAPLHTLLPFRYGKLLS